MLAETITNLEQVMPVGTLFSSKITVIRVPLHTRKQAQLSRPKRFDRCPGVLLRRREVGSQIGLTRHQRRKNMRGAFAVSDPTRILNRDFVLIDDVYTTGTTASECARVLRRAGAARVGVATVARTLKLKVSDVITVPENISEQGVKIASA
jgi:predicted amidophosphoribosyltransferase